MSIGIIFHLVWTLNRLTHPLITCNLSDRAIPGEVKKRLFLQKNKLVLRFGMNIKDQVALVTGAGTGLGRAVAEELSRQGCRVVLVGRRKEKLIETAEGMAGEQKPIIFPMDVASSMEVEDLALEVLRECSQLHILVNNAAVFPENANIQETDVLDWDTTLATNLRGPYLMMRAFLPSMLDADYGRILNISAPLKHYPGAAGYCASKSALDSLTKAVAYENKTRNILVNAVEPPFMDTEMHTGGAQPQDVVPELLKYFDPKDTATRGRIVKLKEPVAGA
jgi:3-oxoacyl-[acyl-carrier protein] reductase